MLAPDHPILDARGLDDPPGVDNPYWEIVRAIPGDPGWMDIMRRWEPAYVHPSQRWALCRRYSWAIPDPAACAYVAGQAGPGGIVEIGAGTGYWAWQLTQRGVSVAAYDIAPPDRADNLYHGALNPDADPATTGRVPLFYPVEPGGPQMAARYSDRTLLLCWPPRNDPMAADALAAYAGPRMVLIGQPEVCGNDAFDRALAAGWEQVDTCPIVNWWLVRDQIAVYERLII